MNKKKTLKKQSFSLEDMKIVKLRDESKFPDARPEQFFKNKKKVGEILLECLIDNDSEAFMEILDAYLRINRSQVAESSGLPRSTVAAAFSKKGNPTLKTIAKIVHEAAAMRR